MIPDGLKRGDKVAYPASGGEWKPGLLVGIFEQDNAEYAVVFLGHDSSRGGALVESFRTVRYYEEVFRPCDFYDGRGFGSCRPGKICIICNEFSRDTFACFSSALPAGNLSGRPQKKSWYFEAAESCTILAGGRHVYKKTVWEHTEPADWTELPDISLYL